MSRSFRLPFALAVIINVFFAVLTASARPAQTASPPNVILIISDDQGWGDYDFMGHPDIKTPNIDRLASQSLTFSRGYVPVSLCRPSLATLATGLYPHQHGITGNDPRQGPRKQMLDEREQMVKIFEKSATLAGLLATKGYVSHQSGKWWEGHHSRGGFTEGMTHGDPAKRGRHGDKGLEIGRKGMQPIFDFIERATEKPGAKPFFIWYAPFLPHTPHNPPKRLLDKYSQPGRPKALARYYAMCDWFDETCGELLGFVDRKGLANNTLVVYVTDNGWIQKTPRSVLPSGWRMPHDAKSKRSPYEGGVRTPIMLRWPGKITPARDDTTLASSIDLVPTILRACGLEPTPEMQGLDLLDKKTLGKRQAIFGEIFTHNAVEIEKPIANLMYRWGIEGRWKLIVPHWANVPDRQAELYDIVSDPHETRDLLTTRPDEAARLQSLIDGWWAVGRRR